MTIRPPDGDPPVSRFRTIADELRAQILDGRFRPGEVLPKQHLLMRRYDVGRDTVQRAQQLLRDEGLLEGGGPGRPARVADGAAMVQPLALHVARAFAARRVSLDVWSLTTEHLSKAVQNQAEAIRESGHGPDSVTVRVMLPDLETRHPYPRHLADPDDPRPLQRMRNVIRMYAGALEHSLTRLAEEGLVRDVSVAIRGLPTIPGEKHYLVNGVELLTGYYRVEECDMHFNSGGAPFKVLELRSGGLFPTLRTSGSALDAARYDEVQAWFGSRWERVARPLPLGD